MQAETCTQPGFDSKVPAVLLQALSEPQMPWRINGEVGDMAGQKITPEPLLDFQRIDVRLDRKPRVKRKRGQEPKLTFVEEIIGRELSHDVVDAPSIGPKTAERLYACEVRTVRDLLAADPKALAEKLDVRHIDAQVLTDWQHQARLVCMVPGLRGTHAQLLVGAGYLTADAIAHAEPEKLCADVLTFATSAEGQRVLRNGDPPDIEKIKGWLELARSAQAA